MISHARVVLLRPSPSGYELLLLRRKPRQEIDSRRESSSASSSLAGARPTGNDATNLPGGGIHDGEDARVGAARNMFEDCGVLLARDTGQAETLEVLTFAALRRQIRDGANATEVIRANGLTWSGEALLPWSHWLAPSIEAVQTSTRIYVAELPGGMRTAFDRTEAVTEHWIAPGSAAALAGELALSPMLVRTCWELTRHVAVNAVFEAARKRAAEQYPILPRLAARANERWLLLPWDPEYETAGQGESHPFTFQPSWAIGPSRFVLEDRAWKHVAAPGSTSAG